MFKLGVPWLCVDDDISIFWGNCSSWVNDSDEVQSRATPVILIQLNLISFAVHRRIRPTEVIVRLIQFPVDYRWLGYNFVAAIKSLWWWRWRVVQLIQQSSDGVVLLDDDDAFIAMTMLQIIRSLRQLLVELAPLND